MSAGTWHDVASAQRVLCYGVTGSGKSTLAVRLGGILDFPMILVDEEMWQPGWVPVPDDEQDRIIGRRLAGQSWVLDSVYGRHHLGALARAEVVVALDYPRPVSLRRLVRRTASGIVSKEPRCNGNVESLGHALSRDSIVRWHFQSFARKRQRMREWYGDPSAPPVVLLSRPVDAHALLANLSRASGAV